MTLTTALCALLLTAEPEAPKTEAKWEQAAKSDGITIYSREKSGSDIREMKAIGLIDGSPHEVWGVLTDYEAYTKTMPYTKEAKILARENEGKTTFFYTRLDLPLVSNRDYILKLNDESDWQEGKGFLKSTWSAWVDKQNHSVAEKDGVVRLSVVDGYWLLEPRENGSKTFATYYVYTDPGGAVPKWLANKANGSAVPNVFNAIRKTVAEQRAAKKP